MAHFPDAGPALTCQRPLFSLPEGLHYLNCAYMSPLSKAVEAAGIEGVGRKRVPTRIPPEAFFADSRRVRTLFGELVNAPAERIALIPAVSYGVATVAKNLILSEGQSVVVAQAQFPSNVYAWRKLAGAGLRAVAPGPDPAGWSERLIETIDETTALVALPHIHWTDGTFFDLEAVGAKARSVGALFVVDGTQSVGALPFDVARIQPDALIVAGYKTMMGPYGMGCAYYGPRFDAGDPLEETWIARRGSEDFSRLVDYQDAYGPGALRFDMGERSNPILLPMLIAALEQLLEWRPERVQAYCRSLMRDTLTALGDLGYQVASEQASARHLFGVRLPEGVSLQRLQASLERHRVVVSLRGDALRVSPNVYNDVDDAAALLAALRAVAP